MRELLLAKSNPRIAGWALDTGYWIPDVGCWILVMNTNQLCIKSCKTRNRDQKQATRIQYLVSYSIQDPATSLEIEPVE